MANIQCVGCTGTGKMKLGTGYSENGQLKTKYMDITCIICNGKGEISEEAVKLLERQRNMWCRCGNKSGMTTFHDDRNGVKHHWTCDDCGKVTQVG